MTPETGDDAPVANTVTTVPEGPVDGVGALRIEISRAGRKARTRAALRGGDRLHLDLRWRTPRNCGGRCREKRRSGAPRRLSSIRSMN